MVLDAKKHSVRDGRGGSNNQEYVRKKGGVSIKRTCAYEGGGGVKF